jgi:hypothetical protein
MLPVSPPMMINVKQCMMREIIFVFQWWRQKISLGTTAMEDGELTYPDICSVQ